MKISDNLRLAVVFMAFAGMLSPMATFGAPPTDAPVRRTANIKDTKLAAGDTLAGKVVDAQGNAIAGTTVSIHRGGQKAAQATTNAQGEFNVAGLTGGVYQVKTQGATANYRVWTANAAPPAATNGVLLVDYQSTVTRGQCGPGGCANSAPAYGGAVYGGPVVNSPVYGGAPIQGGAPVHGGGQVIYGDGGCGNGGCGNGGGAYGDGGVVYGDGGGQVIYGDGGAGFGGGVPCDGGVGAVGVPVDAGFAAPAVGGFGGLGGGGGFLGFLSSPLVIGAGVAAAIAIPLALDDDDDDFAPGAGAGAAAGDGAGAAPGDAGGGAAS